MRMFCCGFNLYGQFINCPSLVIENFTECIEEEVTSLIPAHTFNLAISVKQNRAFIHGSKDGRTHQSLPLQFPDDINIQQVACVDTRILILLKSGDLLKYELDLNTHGAVAGNLVKISCGSKINVALSNNGKLLNLPVELDFKGEVRDIVTGCEHCLIVDDNGRLYSFGRGSRGQLGHGNLDDECEPKLIKALEGIKIKKIAACGWHSCAVSIEGDLYTWGWNSNGQLGIYSNEEDSIAVMATPHVVDFDDDLDVNVVNVACGNRHTIALLSNGRFYGAGWNKYHQLGHASHEKNVYKMTFLHNFCNVNVQELKCGPWSSIVIVH